MVLLEPSRFSIEKFSESHLQAVEGFDNQEKDLVDFLSEDAFENQKKGVSVTYLFFVQEEGLNALAGYITLLSDSIELKQNKELQHAFEDKHIGYRTLPALKIGRMATHSRFQKRGVATAMVKFAISVALDTSMTVGCRFLIVDAKEAARGFYEKKGFRIFKEENSRPTQMYLDLFLK